MNVIEFKRRNKTSEKEGDPLAHRFPPAGVKAIGIDLGTTHSVVSYFERGLSSPVTLEYEHAKLVPSLLFYDKDQDKEDVGLVAKKHLEHSPSQVVRSTKSMMGKPGAFFYSNENQYTPEDVATRLLSYLLEHPFLRQERERFGTLWAVITVPAHFDDAARLATISAAEKAGLSVLRILNEPTAAALAYSLMPDSTEKTEETLAVFDFGGGTFDVSVIDREGFSFHVRSSEGDLNLGGDEIDHALAKHLLLHVEPRFIARRSGRDSVLYRNLLVHAEKAKKELQREGSFLIQDFDLDHKNQGTGLSFELTREEFENISAPIVQRTLFLTEHAMQAAKRNPQKISRILLVGGSTRLSLVRKMLHDYFGCPIDARLEPDLAVSWGAALQAAILLGIQPETVLVDVCSHSLGIGVVDSSHSMNENVKTVAARFGIVNHFSERDLQVRLGDRFDEFQRALQNLLRVAPILHRNTALPACRSEFFNTLYENQQSVHVVVVQGEGKTVGENRLIGSFLFHLKQPCPVATRCEIQLTYDSNGMVQVVARQLGTQNEARAHFDSRTGENIGWLQNEQWTLPASSKRLPTNALVIKVEQLLLSLGVDHPERQRLARILKSYLELLERAQNGEQNDDAIEVVEHELLTFFSEP